MMQTTLCGLPLLAPLSTPKGRDYIGALPTLSKDEIPERGVRMAVGFPPAYSIYVGRWSEDKKTGESGIRWSWMYTKFVETICPACGKVA